MKLSSIALVLLASHFLSPAEADAAEWLVLENARLIDGTGAPLRTVTNIVVRDGVIVAINERGGKAEPETGDVVVSMDLDGAFVMPGLVDTHVHVARFPEARGEAERILRQALKGGVTTVRDLGGDARALAEIRRAMLNHEFSGPTVVHAATFGGESLFAQDERISQTANGYAPGKAPWSKAVTDSSDLDRDVAEARGAGARIAKLYGNLSEPNSRRLIAAAREQGMLAVAHATVFPAGPHALVEAGVDGLAHAPYLIWAAVEDIPDDYSARLEGPWKTVPADHPELLRLFDAMAKRGVYLDATLFVYRDMAKYSRDVKADWAPPAFEWAMRAVRIAHDRGVRITTGTDWFEPKTAYALPNTHEEIALLVEAGLSPMDAIIAATRNGAESSGVGDARGTLVEGKAADMLVLDANPLDDIRNTTAIRLVVKDGRIVR